jgi:hypothetical protein
VAGIEAHESGGGDGLGKHARMLGVDAPSLGNRLRSARFRLEPERRRPLRGLRPRSEGEDGEEDDD